MKLTPEVLKRRSKCPRRAESIYPGLRFGMWTFLSLDVDLSIQLRSEYWQRQCDCGRVKPWKRVRGLESISCGCVKTEARRKMGESRRGENNPQWRGGRRKTGCGYIKVLMPGHPRAEKSGCVREHFLVIEKIIGRPVLKTEDVHHKNGIRNDNRPENLELWDRSHPRGQRHEDKMRFYMSELLKKCDRSILHRFCTEVIS